MEDPNEPWEPRRPHAGRGGGRGRGGHGRSHPLAGGPRPRHRGGRARRGQVRLAALLLIEEEPRNGYQIIAELDARTDGRWKPSPGAVYPALSQLEDEGLIALTEDRKAYQLTDGGRAEAEQAGQARKPWELEPEADDAASQLQHAFHQLGAALGAVVASGDDELIGKATGQLEDARRSLYKLLADS